MTKIKTAVVVMALIAALAVAGCGESSTKTVTVETTQVVATHKTAYPTGVIAPFVNSCIQASGRTSTCICIGTWVEKNVPIDTFEAQSQKYIDAKQLPTWEDQAIGACAGA